MSEKNYDAVNWNNVEDQVDMMSWNKLVSQFWLDTRIPVSNDLDDWRKMPADEKEVLNRAFAGLTLLDTLQSQDGVPSIINDAVTPLEIAVLNNIQFMESVHAKSYSTIFITLNNKNEIDNVFDFANNNEFLQFKAERINGIYQTGTPLQRKAASVVLESFLFYSGFYAILRFLGENRMASTAEIIKLIIKDESVHGTYIGYKFQKGLEKLSTEEQEEVKEWVYSLLYEMYSNEVKYSALVYDKVGWTSEVKVFLRYNANKALANLGYDPLFPDTAADVNPIIINGLSGSATNHDFFSKVGNSYFMGNIETMSDNDYDFDAISRDKK